MPELLNAKDSFRFYSKLNLTELTGLKAATISQLASLLKVVPGSSIYHHTHRFLQQHQFLSPEPPNDFAYWVSNVLGENGLGEMLESIDTVQYKAIRTLRERIIEVVEGYLSHNPSAERRFAKPGDEFHFMKSVSFIFPTKYSASNLKEFAESLSKITVDSIYFHIFESRLRLEKGENDFSLWLDKELGESELAREIARLDPYTYTMEDLRAGIIKIINRKLK